MSDPAVPGSINFREVVGIPATSGVVRPGVLFRSGNLAGLDDAGVRAIAELGIRQVIDLRADDEVTRDPSRVPESATIQRVPIFLGSVSSFFSSDVSLTGLYRAMITESGERIVQVIRALIADRPAVVHCTVGKDRTGVSVALILAAVGAEEDAIVADYARTEALLPEERNRQVLARLRAAHPEAQHLADLATRSPAPVMREFLAWVREQYGSVPEYLAGHGLTEAELIELRDVLVT